jgi:hypothetical protein
MDKGAAMAALIRYTVSVVGFGAIGGFAALLVSSVPAAAAIFGGSRTAVVVVTYIALAGLPILSSDLRGWISILWPFQSRAKVTLARVAKMFSKKGDLKNAARWYSELLTYGFSMNLYVGTSSAYKLWEKLPKRDVPCRFVLRDLLFVDRLHAWIFFCQQPTQTSLQESSKGELTAVASDSPRLLAFFRVSAYSNLQTIADAVRAKAPALAEAIVRVRS